MLIAFENSPGVEAPGLKHLLNVTPKFESSNYFKASTLNNNHFDHSISNLTKFCRTMIHMFDTNSTGTIDINEFGRLFAYIQQWKAMFENFDRDRCLENIVEN